LVARMKLGEREKTILLVLVIVIAVFGLVIGLSLGLTRDRTSHDAPDDSSAFQSKNMTKNTTVSTSLPTTTSSTSSTSSPSSTTSSSDAGYDSTYRKYRFAAVTTDTEICSQIGVLEDSLFLVVLSSFSLHVLLCLDCDTLGKYSNICKDSRLSRIT